MLAIHCGLRNGELLGLRWEDVDFGAGKLRVNRQLQRMRDGSGLIFSPLKNAKGRRTIRIANAAVKALSSHRMRQAKHKLRFGSLYWDQGLVFTTQIGTPLDASNIDKRSFKPLLLDATLRN